MGRPDFAKPDILMFQLNAPKPQGGFFMIFTAGNILIQFRLFYKGQLAELVNPGFSPNGYPVLNI